MAHLVPARPAWHPLDTILPADWAAIDQNTFVAINGDNGGTWTPSAAINIGGAGMWFAGLTILSGVVPFGSISEVITSYPSARITFGSNDFFQIPYWHPGQSRIIVNSCGASRGSFGWNSIRQGNLIQSGVPGCRGLVPLQVHQKAVLQTVTLTYRIASSHFPQFLFKFRIIAVNDSGAIFPLIDASGSNDANGFYSPPATTASQYYGAGAVQTIVVSPFAPLIDKTKFRYYADIVDESGTGALLGNQFIDVSLNFTNILDTKFQ